VDLVEYEVFRFGNKALLFVILVDIKESVVDRIWICQQDICW